MKLVLYSPEERDFAGLGLGVLEHVQNDEVREVLNGLFELQLQYPIDGRLFHQIQQNAYITARPNAASNAQPFRIYRIHKTLGGWVTIYARHISYRLGQIPSTRMEGADIPEALRNMEANKVGDCPFRFFTDLEHAGYFQGLPYPQSIKERLLVLRELHPCDFEFDGYDVRLLVQRGQDRGVCIRYGYNMKDVQLDQQLGENINGIYGYRTDEYGIPIEVDLVMSEAYQEGQETRILTRDYTNYSDVMTVREHAQSDLRLLYDKGLDGSEWILKVDFEQLSRTEEYRNQSLPDDIGMGDMVRVTHVGLGIHVSLRAIEIRYQPSQGRYKSVTLGSTQKSILDTIMSK